MRIHILFRMSDTDTQWYKYFIHSFKFLLMNVKFIIAVAFFVGFENFVLSQTSQHTYSDKSTVNWLSQSSWDKALRAAQSSRKLIFVDMVATWCSPCKEMDRTTFSDTSVVQRLNRDFVSIKLQIDTTAQDARSVKQNYGKAAWMAKTFNVTSLPTFLVFNSAGEILHKSVGFKNTQQFLKEIDNSLNENRQFYTLLKQLKSGSLPRKDHIELLAIARTLNEREVEQDLLKSLKSLINSSISFDSISTNEWKFIQASTKLFTSNDKIIKAVLYNMAVVDGINGKGFSRGLVHNVILKEFVTPFIDSCKLRAVEPDWLDLKDKVRYKYKIEYVEDLVLKGQLIWYSYARDWVNYTKRYVEMISRNDTVPVKNGWGAWGVNGNAWTVFVKADSAKNRYELETALGWSEKVLNVDSSANYVDTKACLLYKLGYLQESIRLEELALQMVIQAKLIEAIKEYTQRLRLMKSGLPTW